MMAMPWSIPHGRWIDERLIEEGRPLPRFHGVAWTCPYSHRAYCLPMPVNKLAGLCRRWWLWLKQPVDDHIGDAYNYGHSIGMQKGYDSGLRQGIRLSLTAKDSLDG